MTEPLPPHVDASAVRPIAPRVWVIPDHRVPLVPNIGIVVGDRAALVIDTGMGVANGARVLAAAKALAGDRRLFLTLTHFHPEHGFGAQCFRGEATILYNAAQRDELAAKGAGYLALFRGMNPVVEATLRDVELVTPDIAYEGPSCELDLGGCVVELRAFGAAHTRGDQTAWVKSAGVLFVGDLAEESTFPIFPWFPPHDADVDAARWVDVLAACERLAPAIVVPGHGEVGDVAIPRGVREFILDVEREVAALPGLSADARIATLRPRFLAEHPDWHFPEWIDFAIRYFVDKAG